MTGIPIYQVDAFTDRPFGGNPAAVCPLEEWLDDEVMQLIAAENNLSETAFFVADGNGYHLRWFTPQAEVDLCGHATLASAAAIFEKLDPTAQSVLFQTRSGPLTVDRAGDRLVMDFPALPAKEVPVPDGLVEAIGVEPVQFLRAVKNMAVLEGEAAVRGVTPDLGYVKNMQGMGLIVTAPGVEADCASRYFAPHVGIAEDPVTGSAHCTIIPYWSERLGKTNLHAQQVSARHGDLYCRMNGDRVELAGSARLIIEGTLFL
jgi:PhzF family phenazine biosynthesis protein